MKPTQNKDKLDKRAAALRDNLKRRKAKGKNDSKPEAKADKNNKDA